MEGAPWLRFGVAGNTVIQMRTSTGIAGCWPSGLHSIFPATIQAGVAIDLRPDLTLMADYKRIWFSSIAAVNNPSTNLDWQRPLVRTMGRVSA